MRVFETVSRIRSEAVRTVVTEVSRSEWTEQYLVIVVVETEVPKVSRSRWTEQYPARESCWARRNDRCALITRVLWVRLPHVKSQLAGLDVSWIRTRKLVWR